MLSDADPRPFKPTADAFLAAMPTFAAELNAQPAPCRFCGEAEHLKRLPEYSEGWTHNADGSLVRASTGQPILAMLDYIECEICGVEAPAHVWNRPTGATPAERAAVIAGWAEYDGEGRWTGEAR